MLQKGHLLSIAALAHTVAKGSDLWLELVPCSSINLSKPISKPVPSMHAAKPVLCR